jgi:hypothetical protein
VDQLYLGNHHATILRDQADLDYWRDPTNPRLKQLVYGIATRSGYFSELEKGILEINPEDYEDRIKELLEDSLEINFEH